MSRKPSQREIEFKAGWLTFFLGLLTVVLSLILYCVSKNDTAFWPGMLVIATTFSVTTMYFVAQSRTQSKIAAFIAFVVSIYILGVFPEQAKISPFFAASKQLIMVLYAGAGSLLFDTTLANRQWQKTHRNWSGICAGIPLSVPFLIAPFDWKYQDGLADICAIFVASTFGTIYLKEFIRTKLGKNRSAK